MLRTLLIIVALSSLARAWVPRRGRFDSPEEAESFVYRRAALDSMLDVVEELANEIMDPTEYELLMQEIEEIQDNPGNPRVDCAGCRALIATVRGFLNQGLDYWDVRDFVFDVCYQLVNNSVPGSRYDLICDVCDIYGPHIMYILNTTDETPLELCTLFNNCDPVLDPEPTTEAPSNYDSKPEVPRKRHAKREAKSGRPNIDGALKLVHLADIHVDQLYLEGEATDCGLPVCCREAYTGQGVSGYWGEFECNIPPYTVELLLRFAADLDPDIVVYAGDSPPHDLWEETHQRQLNVTQWVAEVIEKNLPGIPAYSSIGNHEPFPTNLYYSPRLQIQEFNELFANSWAEMSGFGEEQLETVLQAGYYSIPVPDFLGLRVITYNSNFGYTDNYYGPMLQDDIGYLDMKSYVESELEDARQNGEKVLLIGHHKTGSGGMFIFFSRWVSDIALEYTDTIILHMVGHSHVDNFRMTTDLESGEVYDVQMCAPAITAREGINPSVRVIYLDPETYAPLDYDQYNLDLDAAMGSDEEPEIRLFYRASEEFGLSDLTPASYGEFVDRMEVDQDLFERYRYLELTGARTPGPCTGGCKDYELCAIRTTAYEDFKKCIGDWP